MARNIGMGRNSPLYRAVIVATYTEDSPLDRDLQLYRRRNPTIRREGLTLTWYEGPYTSPGQARGRRTVWERIYASKADSARVKCDIEVCEPDWKHLPPLKPRPSEA
ncbi:hypothetical protein [Streptomyces californicus]|uniref:hypothetical protein n=1 Tax=Streptomyces californicus TaxID=67351 RepID=UPI0037122ABE